MESVPLLLSLLILCVCGPPLCGATDYYVRPTEPTNASCPGQPCLTLHHYIQNLSSNANYHLLPGVHSINGPITLKYVHNVSMAAFNSSETKIAATIECNSRGSGSLYSLECSGISFQDASDITISSLSIELKLLLPSHNAYRQLSIAGMSFKNSTDVVIQGLGIWMKQTWPVDNVFVIAFSDCANVEMSSLTVTNGGIDVTLSSNVSISNANITSPRHGINIVQTCYMCVSNITIVSWSGIHLNTTSFTNISNVVVLYSNDSAVSLEYTRNITLRNIAIHSAGRVGIEMRGSNRSTISGVHIMQSNGNGIYADDVYHVIIANSTVEQTQKKGIVIYHSSDIHINDTHVMQAGINTLDIYKVSNITIANTALVNAAIGANIVRCYSVTFWSVTIGDWNLYGVHVYDSYIVSLINISLVLNTTLTKIKSGLLFWICKSVTIDQSIIANFPSSELVSDIYAQKAVIVLYNSKENILIKNCNFIANNITAVKVVNSEVRFSGSVNFTNNIAYRGAAMVFMYSGKMILSKDSHIIYKNNYAYTTGGAIYSTSTVDLPSDSSYDEFTVLSDCFMEVEGGYSQARLTFQNNSAAQGGDIVYGGSLGRACKNGPFCDSCQFKFLSVSSIKTSTLSPVSSDPSRVCLCAYDKPDCLTIFETMQNNEHGIYPGQILMISAVVVGQNFGTVAGSVYAQFVKLPSTDNTPQLAQRQDTQGVEHTKCNLLQYTIYSQPGDITLMLTAVKLKETYIVASEILAEANRDYISYQNNEPRKPFPQDMLEFPVYINIPLQPYPPGFALTHENPVKCDCVRQLNQLPGVTCHIEDVTFYRSGLVWVGQLGNANNTDNETLGEAHVASAKYCPFNYCRNDGVRISLSRYDHQCNFNHSGTVCGGCRHGLSLALGSAQCLQCSNTYLLLFIPFAVAGPVLVAFIKVLDITISHGLINSLIFYANIIKPNEHIFLPQTNTNPLTLFIAWLNLDLGVQTCFYDGLSAYGKAWLQFVFPFYVWCIAGLIIVLARYSTRFARLTGYNSVPVLATLFLLSYAKLLRTIITILSYTTVDSANGQKTVWSADGNIDYLGPQHTPLFLAALATLLLLWLPYTLLLLSAHWIRKINTPFLTRVSMKVKPFLDAHYGPVNDKHCYWFGALLGVRIVILLISATVPASNFSVSTLSVSVAAGALVSYIAVGPPLYRYKTTAVFEVALFINLALLGLAKFYVASAGGNQTAATLTLVAVAFAQFFGLVVYQLYSVFLKSLFSQCHQQSHDEDDKAAEVREEQWRYNTSVRHWETPQTLTPCKDA